jgi:hypothetical protein
MVSVVLLYWSLQNFVVVDVGLAYTIFTQPVIGGAPIRDSPAIAVGAQGGTLLRAFAVATFAIAGFQQVDWGWWCLWVVAEHVPDADDDRVAQHVLLPKKRGDASKTNATIGSLHLILGDEKAHSPGDAAGVVSPRRQPESR